MNAYFDYDRYDAYYEMNAIYYDDGSHSYDRRRELARRKYSGYDTFTGESDSDDWN